MQTNNTLHLFIVKQKAAMQRRYLYKVAGLSLFLSTSPIFTFASDVGITDTADVDNWPWTKFLNSLADQLTGPLPTTLGVMGIAAAAIAMFAGHGGAGTQKFIMLVFAISICLFAPNFVEIITDSAGGATIYGV